LDLELMDYGFLEWLIGPFRALNFCLWRKEQRTGRSQVFVPYRIFHEGYVPIGTGYYHFWAGTANCTGCLGKASAPRCPSGFPGFLPLCPRCAKGRKRERKLEEIIGWVIDFVEMSEDSELYTVECYDQRYREAFCYCESEWLFTIRWFETIEEDIYG
jgi:hypothetical protein